MSKVIGLGARLRRLITELDGAVQQAYDAAGVDFRPRFYPAVRALVQHGPLGIVELATKCGVTQPAMTQTVQELRRAGLVVSSVSQDRRSRLIELSDSGRVVVTSLDRIWAAVEGAARELDDELPCSLSGTVDEALEALSRTPFTIRIERHL